MCRHNLYGRLARTTLAFQLSDSPKRMFHTREKKKKPLEKVEKKKTHYPANKIRPAQHLVHRQIVRNA